MAAVRFFITPGNRGGGMFAGDQPFVRILMRRKNQRGIVHRVQATRHRILHHRGAFRAAGIEHVVALFINHRKMGVQARTRIFGVGFGHKAGGKAVATRQTLSLSKHLEQPGIIGGAQGVVAMHQVDFKLPRPVSEGGGVCRDVHRFTGVIEVGEEGVEGVKGPDRQGFCGFTHLAGTGRGGGLQVLAGIVDQRKTPAPLRKPGSGRGP